MKFSVICPTFNSEKFLDKTSESILNQSFNDFEIIFSDDGSSDNTIEVIDNFKKKFLKKNIEVKVLLNKHKGPGHARNEAIKISKYDWIAFVDSDDIWESNKLEKVNQVLNNYSEFNCILHRQYFKNKKNKIKFHKYDKYFNPKKKVFNQIFKSNFIATSSVVINKKLLIKYNGFDESLENAQDYDLWLKIGNDFNIFIIKDYLGTNVERNNNISSRPYKKRLKNILKIIFKHYGRVNKFLFLYRLLRLLISNQWFK